MMINKFAAFSKLAQICHGGIRCVRGVYSQRQLIRQFQSSSVLASSDVWTRFEQAQKAVEQLPSSPGNSELLKLYAMYKQATQGDNENEAPSRMNMVKHAKWKAWSELKSMSKEEAANKYIELCQELGADVDGSNPGTKATDSAQSRETADGAIKISNSNGVYEIRLNRPKKKNAITFQMYLDIQEALKEAQHDDSVRVVVLTGDGDYYSSGNDLSNFTNIPEGGIEELADRAGDVLNDFVSSFIDFPKVLVAAVNGPAVGIPVTTLPLCDIVYASSAATFHTPFSALGQSPEACSSYTFPKVMGQTRAAEVLLFGRKLTASEAQEYGLVSRVFDHETFSEEVNRHVQEAAKLPPQSLQLSKNLICDFEREKLREVNEKEITLIKSRWTSDECMNAIMKFMSK